MPPSSYQTPDARNLYIGSGIVQADRYSDSTKLRSGNVRHLGMVKSVQITPSRDSVSIKNEMDGAKGLYDETTVGLGGELSMVLTEAAKHNMALQCAGAVAAFTQSSGTATLLAVSTGTVKLGFGLYTGKKDIVVTAVQKSGGSALGAAEWSYNSNSGIITINDGATTVADGDSITWTGTYPAIAGFKVEGLTTPDITMAINFVSASNSKGPRGEWDFHKVRLSAKSALDLIGDTYGEITITGQLLADTTQASGDSPYFKYREI